jgi:ribonucleotide reductase beta subunit family protein with ferritin-like domain
VSDRLLVQLGYGKLWDVNNPFPFMARIGLDLKSNFFEMKSTNYSKAKVGKENVYQFKLDAAF